MKHFLIFMSDDQRKDGQIIDGTVTYCETEELMEAILAEGIFGEPLTKLDPDHREEFEGYLEEIRQEGVIHFEGDPSIYYFTKER